MLSANFKRIYAIQFSSIFATQSAPCSSFKEPENLLRVAMQIDM